MGRRIYKSTITAVTIGTAVQDIWSLLAGAANGIQLHWLQLSAGGVTIAPDLSLRLKRGTATVTIGSGGTLPAKSLVADGDSKVSGSPVHANDTTQATTSGNFTGYVE